MDIPLHTLVLLLVVAFFLFMFYLVRSMLNFVSDTHKTNVNANQQTNKNTLKAFQLAAATAVRRRVRTSESGTDVRPTLESSNENNEPPQPKDSPVIEDKFVLEKYMSSAMDIFRGTFFYTYK